MPKVNIPDTFISIVVILTVIIRKPSNRYNSCFMWTPTLPVLGVQIVGDSAKRCDQKKTATSGWG